MTHEEKLGIFYDLSMESAKAQCEEMLSGYRANLEKEFAEHRSLKESSAAERLGTETVALERELKRDLSDRQNELRRKLAESQDEVKDAIFTRASEKLAAFRETPEYRSWLFNKVKGIKEFADKDEVTVYIDPEDAEYLDAIGASADILPVISRESFGGGIRAVIRSRKILIDNSFDTLLAEEKDRYRFDGGNLNG